MQVTHIFVGGDLQTVELPDATEEVVPGTRWGDAGLPLTPAWLAKHAHMRVAAGMYDGLFGNGATTLAEDTVFCLLGGFGIKAEVADAAFRRLAASGLFDREPDQDAIEADLRTPLRVGERSVRYRFPASRARYIAGALEHLRARPAPSDDLGLRDYLQGIPGIGPKTASYIVRNHVGSDRVAILDIHVLRAFQAACLFPAPLTLPRHYSALEEIFLHFAAAAGIKASLLDLAIWEVMRRTPDRVTKAAARLNRSQLLAGGKPLVYVADYLGA